MATPGFLSTAKRGVLALCFAALSVLMVAAAAFNTYAVATYHTLDGRAVGVVVSQNGGKGCDSTVAFTVNEKDYKTSYSSCPGYGEQVLVRYETADPSHATGSGPLRNYVTTPLMVVLFIFLSFMFGLLTLTHFELFRGREPDAKLNRIFRKRPQ